MLEIMCEQWMANGACWALKVLLFHTCSTEQ